jgi:hypothetical protein
MADPSEQGDDEPQDVDGLFNRALDQYHTLCTVQQEERARSLQARRFATIPGAQWEGAWGDAFANSIMVEVNKVARGTEKIIDDYRANRLTVEFRTVNDNPGDEETAETLNGLFLADVYLSKGQQAFDCGFEEAVTGGMGAWRLVNRYVDEYDEDDDSQCIGIEVLPDADQRVFFDPDALLYDKSDAKWCIVVTPMSPAAYKETYKDDPASWPQDLLKAHYDWYTPDLVRIAEYYHKIEETEDRLTFEHTLTGDRKKLWRSELQAGDFKDMQTQGWRQMGRKPVKRCRVEKLTFSLAGEVAPRQMIAGTEIPVIPVYGKRWYVDNLERWRGHVALSMDAQRLYNASLSRLAETSAYSPIGRPILTPEQVQGHEDEWANANIDRLPYVLVNKVTTNSETGETILQGPLGTLDPPSVAPATAALLQLMASDIAELTTNTDNSVEVKSNVSAEAMDIAATRTDAKSFTYMDNMRQSMQRTGEVYQSMAKEVYAEVGRRVPTMTEDGQHGFATLGEERATPKGVLYAANDIAGTKLNVIADVTEATSTRRDKTVKACMSAAAALGPIDPQGAQVLTGIAFMNMDGEGLDDAKDWWRQRLIQQGAIKPTPQEQQAMAEAAQQQGQQPPSPQAQVLQAQTEKEQALTVKAQADAQLSKSQAIKNLAEAHAKGRETDLAHAQALHDATKDTIDAQLKAEAQRVGNLHKLNSIFGAQAEAVG